MFNILACKPNNICGIDILIMQGNSVVAMRCMLVEQEISLNTRGSFQEHRLEGALTFKSSQIMIDNVPEEWKKYVDQPYAVVAPLLQLENKSDAKS